MTNDFGEAFDSLKDTLSETIEDHGWDASFRAMVTLTALLALDCFEGHKEASSAMTDIFSENSLMELTQCASRQRMS